MVRVEIVRDVRVNPRPRLERLELELWLGHVRLVKVEVAQVLSTRPSVIVRRVESLVVFNEADEPLALGELYQRLVVLELLSRRLGNHDMVAEIQCLAGNRKVRRVGSEDDNR